VYNIGLTGAADSAFFCPIHRGGLDFYCALALLRRIGLDILTVDWSLRLDDRLDMAFRQLELKNPINMISQILLVSLIMLSLNHQNYKQLSNEAVFLTPAGL